MDFIQSESGGIAMALVALALYAGILFWASRRQDKHRWSVVAAATSSGIVVLSINAIARAIGWWDWWGYQLHLLIQIALLLVGTSIIFTLSLTGYRWLETHSRNPLRIYGVISIAVLGPLTVIGDWYNIERGKLAFGGGYTIWQDVLVGQALFWLPVVLYRAIRTANSR
ncbi:MAG: hypothetical protein HY070_08720 [Chloroflexi bacterium]|nr:hypothetical protein [Chloroflexota bacterium]